MENEKESIETAAGSVRVVDHVAISDAVRTLFIEANYRLPPAVCHLISSAKSRERDPVARGVLDTLEENIAAADEMDVPICQDTGMAVLFCEIGHGVYIDANLEDAVNDGVRRAYIEGSLRKSIVRDPLYDRTNTEDNTPAALHISFSADPNLVGSIRLTAAPKGFGSENMSAIKMFTPSATEADIIQFVVDSVLRAGANPCPPIVVGVGIGANFEGVALLAKTALLRDTPAEDAHYRNLEEKLLRAINETGIGPQGFGGDTTALAVRVNHAPTHIAGLPVAVNINCHVSRHKSVIL